MNITQETNNQFSNSDCNYDRINYWSTVFGAPVFKNLIKQPEPERYELLINLITEECNECIKEHSDNNLEKLVLELGDLLWVTIRAMMEIGVEPKDVIAKIYNANMSKACSTLREAELSVKMYANGTHPHKLGENIDAYYEKILNLYVIRRKSDNKILKSIYTQKP